MIADEHFIKFIGQWWIIGWNGSVLKYLIWETFLKKIQDVLITVYYKWQNPEDLLKFAAR